MGEYTIPSSVAIDSQHQVLVCTHSHKQNETKQKTKEKEFIYHLLNACYTPAEKRTYSQVSGTELSLLCPHPPPPWLTLLHLYKWDRGQGGRKGTLTLLVE